MKISCEEASEICNKSQYREATLLEIVKLKLHVFLCKTCRMFTSKNTKLTQLCKNAELQMFSEEEKEKMKQALQEQDSQ